MSNINIPYPDANGNTLELRNPLELLAGLAMTMALGGVAAAEASFASGSAGADVLSGDMDALKLSTNLANAFTLSGVSFSAGGQRYIAKASGDLQVSPSPTTGIGTSVGSISPAAGAVELTSWAPGMAPAVSDWRGVAAAPVNSSLSPFNTYAVTFRISTAPIRPGTFSVLGTMQDGTTFNYSADSDGVINQPRVKGRINYQTGVVKLVGVSPTAPAGVPKTDISFLDISGQTEAYIDLISQETLRYNATAFTYLPLDAELLGIDAVRLPSDGKVPIFQQGDLAVVGNTQSTTPQTVANAQTVSTGRTRLSRLRVIGTDGHVIVNGYTEDLEAGTVTFTDVTGYSQPVHVEHRIEDAALIRDAQIDGTITFTKQMSHDYPAEGTYVSSMLRAGDLFSRTQLVFDQLNWDGVTYSDTPGTPATASYNTNGYPITVTNDGAYTERFALRFKSSTSVEIFGEHLGGLGEYSINAPIQPINPVTNKPYFRIEVAGWGSGWINGNMLRINTVGANFVVWMIRTVQQGAEAAADYSFLTIIRGDVDNPLA